MKQLLLTYLVATFFLMQAQTLADVQKNPKKIVITAEEIKDSHLSSFLNVIRISPSDAWSDLSDVLKFEKGLNVKSFGGPGSLATVNIRGVGAAKAEHILVLLDGVKLNTAQGSGVDLSQIPTSIIDRIELIRGGESALYGADAIGGVINIVTHQKHPDLSYSFSKDSWRNKAGQARYHKFSISTGRTFGKFHFYTQAHSTKNLGDFSFKNPITLEDDERKFNDHTARGFLFKSTWKPSNALTLAWTQEFFSSKNKTPGALSFTGKPSPSFGYQKSLRNLSVLTAVWKHSKSDTTQLTLPFRFNRRTFKSPFEDSKYDNTHVGPKLRLTRTVTDQHLLQLIGEVTHDRLKSRDHSKQPQRTNVGIAIKDDFFVNEALTLASVLRWDYTPNLYSSINPKVGLTWDVSPRFQIRSNLSKNFRAPSFDELYIDLKGDKWRYTGNPDLKPERAWTADVGFLLKRKWWSVSRAFFISHVNDLIFNESSFAGGTMTTRPVNEKREVIWGTESSVDLKIPFLKNISSRLSHTWIKSDLPYRPRNTISSLLQWQNSIAKVFLSHHWTSSVNTGHPMKPKLPSVQTLDMGTTFQLSKSFSLSAKVTNIFDRAYERVAYYPMPGRLFSLNLTGRL